MVTQITSADFEDEVLKSSKPVLVDFWASWCGPCRMVSPMVDQLSEEHPEYKFCKVNVDDEEALAIKFGIMSIPSLFIFKDGKVTNKQIGLVPKEQILALFNK